MQLRLALLLLLSTLTFADTVLSPSSDTLTTVTGTVMDLTSTPVTAGKVTFDLQPGIATTISGSAAFSPQTVTCAIDSTGSIKAADGSSDCIVTRNTSIQPPKTYYLVCIWPNNVKSSCFNWYARTFAEDITTVVPTPATAAAFTFVDTFANQSVGGNKTWTGNETWQGTADFSASKFIARRGTLAQRPACTDSAQIYYQTDATAGQQVFGCNPPTWVLQGDGGGGGGLSTIKRYIWLPAGECDGSTAFAAWGNPVSGGATAACISLANDITPVLDFADTGAPFRTIRLPIPSAQTGTVDAKIIWSTATASGTAQWQLSGFCTAMDGTQADDSTFTAFYSPAATASPSTANFLTTTSGTGISLPAGCGSAQFLHLKLARVDVSGTGRAVTARVRGVELTITTTVP